MMKAIYASKLYKTSTRKDKIHAAMESPVNAELVSQLAKYLDEDYQTPEYLGADSPDAHEAEAKMPEDLDPGASGDFSPSDNLVHVPSGGGGNLPPMPEDLDAEPFSDDEGSDTIDEGGEDLGGDDLGDEDVVEESTRIMSCTDIDSAAIKGLLNSKQDTAGVNRLQSKESELWIYYNDDINLNNVMTQVIETLNAASYTYLEFNRLARSDNAIVFQFIEPQEMKSIEVEDESK